MSDRADELAQRLVRVLSDGDGHLGIDIAGTWFDWDTFEWIGAIRDVQDVADELAGKLATALRTFAEEASAHWKREAENGAAMLAAIHRGLGLLGADAGGISAQDVLGRVDLLASEARREERAVIEILIRMSEQEEWPKNLWFSGFLSRKDAIQLGELLTAIQARGEKG